MLTYFSNVLSGTAEPFWPHLVLISVSVAASFAVAGGIIFESPKYSPATHRVATSLVIGGVAIEALCMVCLFVVDEAISGAQQEKIIILETKLAPRFLSDAKIAKALSELEKFSDQKFTLASYGGEPMQLAARIRGMLEKARWKWFDPEMQILLLPGTVGIQVWAYTDGSRNAARAFIATLKGNDIEATLLPELPQPPPPDGLSQIGIEILVGSKY